MTRAQTIDTPALPGAHGPLSTTIRNRLTGPASPAAHFPTPASHTEPYGLDLQLALCLCYELHYRGFAGVDPTWEWHAELLALRADLERVFLSAVYRDTEQQPPPTTVADEMDALAIEPAGGGGLSRYLQDTGTWAQMREYFVQRSLYHLKEGDPHAWTIPRLTGQAKASFVAIEFDEYGAGRGPRLHQQLFADLMSAAGLDEAYLGYLEAVPAEALAAVNLMSLFGLHRRWRGASVGHFAATEITSPPGSRRLVAALTRLEAPQPCIEFYREHVEADAVHEQVVRNDVVGDLLRREPDLEADVVFGIRAYNLIEDRLAEAMMRPWLAGRSSLRAPLA